MKRQNFIEEYSDAQHMHTLFPKQLNIRSENCCCTKYLKIMMYYFLKLKIIFVDNIKGSQLPVQIPFSLSCCAFCVRSLQTAMISGRQIPLERTCSVVLDGRAVLYY